MENKKDADTWLLSDAGEIQRPVLFFSLINIPKQSFQYREGSNKCLLWLHITLDISEIHNG